MSQWVGRPLRKDMKLSFLKHVSSHQQNKKNRKFIISRRKGNRYFTPNASNTASGISHRTLVLLINKTQTAAINRAIKCMLENNVHILLYLSPKFALCFLWSYDGQRAFTIVVLLVSFPDVLGSTTRRQGTRWVKIYIDTTHQNI